MRKKFLIAFSVVGAVMVVFLGIVAAQPSDFKVVRTIQISASPEDIFPHVNDLHSWEAWSPWAKLDPNAKNSFSGEAAGKGAIFHWAGNNDVGEGQMTIVESRPHELVRIKLDFVRPFEGTNDVELAFKSAGDRTTVSWQMSGPLNFITKGIGLFLSMDKMCGDQFEQGLANLKKIVEIPAKD